MEWIQIIGKLFISTASFFHQKQYKNSNIWSVLLLLTKIWSNLQIPCSGYLYCSHPISL